MIKKQLIPPVALCVGTLLCTAARVLTIAQTDMKLGSLKHGAGVLCNALYFGALIAAAIIAAVFAASGKDKAGKANPQRLSGRGAVAVGFGLLALGCGVAYDAIFVTKIGIISTIFMIVSFVFAAAFAVLGFVTLYKKEITPALGFAYSFGGVFFALRGIFCFMNRMAIATIPEYLLDVLSAVFGGIFFVMAGKLLSGNEGALTRKMIVAWGTGAAELTLSTFLGTAAAKLFLGKEVSQWIVLTSAEANRYFQSVQGMDGYRLAFPAFASVGLGVLAAACVIALSLNEKESEKPDVGQ